MTGGNEMLEVLLIVVLSLIVLYFVVSGLGALIGLIIFVPYHLVRSTIILAFWALKVIWTVFTLPFRLVGIGR